MNHRVSAGERGQVHSPAQQSRTDSPPLIQFFPSRAGGRLTEVAHQHLSNHMAEILSKYDSVEEAGEQFVATQLYSEIPTIFPCFENAHHEFLFLVTSFSSEMM